MNRKLNVCLIVSGSIAAYKACALAGKLVRAGHEVQAVATESALRFVGVASLEGLTGRKAYVDQWDRRGDITHVSLRKWADLYIVYPATANRINSFAAGIANDLAGAAFLANNFEKPFWIAPAMNSGMIGHPATVAALSRLESWGCRIVRGDTGRLACGDVGSGRLAEPEEVFSHVQEEASRQAGVRAGGIRPRALVTGGAMTEPIDAVRSIVNKSTGRTASAIAGAFLDRGWEVVYLHHEGARLAGSEGARLVPYSHYTDFARNFESLLKNGEFDAIVQAAAVSDYCVFESASGKIESSDAVTVRLEPTVKLLPMAREFARGAARGRPTVVGFKLTSGLSPDNRDRAVSSILASADLAVWNDASGVGDNAHEFEIYSCNPRAKGEKPVSVARGSDNAELAGALVDLVEKRRKEL